MNLLVKLIHELEIMINDLGYHNEMNGNNLLDGQKILEMVYVHRFKAQKNYGYY